LVGGGGHTSWAPAAEQTWGSYQEKKGSKLDALKETGEREGAIAAIKYAGAFGTPEQRGNPCTKKRLMFKSGGGGPLRKRAAAAIKRRTKL